MNFSVPIKRGEGFEELSNCQLLKEDLLRGVSYIIIMAPKDETTLFYVVLCCFMLLHVVTYFQTRYNERLHVC